MFINKNLLLMYMKRANTCLRHAHDAEVWARFDQEKYYMTISNNFGFYKRFNALLLH